MRAIVTRLLPDKRREKVLVDQWPDPPAPQGNQVKTRTLYTGISNGTERNDLVGGNYAHPDDMLPAGWGYQNVGEVIQVGPEVKTLQVGDRVFLNLDHTEYGLMAEDDLLVKLPPEVDPKQAALFGVAGVAVHDVRRAGTKLGDHALVVGAGPIGQFTAQAARAGGAHVTVVDVDARRLEIARQCGAHRVLRAQQDADWGRLVRGAGLRFDIVFEDSGAPVLDTILGVRWGESILKPRGKLVLVAGRGDVQYSFNAGQSFEAEILHASHFDRSDLEVLCWLVGLGVVRIGPVLQDVCRPADAKRIYDTLRDEPGKLFGTIFDWTHGA